MTTLTQNLPQGARAPSSLETIRTFLREGT